MEVGGILAVPTKAPLESTNGAKMQQHYKKQVERYHEISQPKVIR